MRKYLFIILLFIVFLPDTIYGQQDSLQQFKAHFDQYFGMDVSLYSGQYYYPETNVVEGSPFWENKSILVGNVYMAGKTFESCSLRYHLNRKEFILVFDDRNGANRQIILDANKIDSIIVGDALFIPNPFPAINNRFVQVISQNQLPCYISWSIEKNFITTGDNVGYHYLNSKFETYVLVNGNVFKIRKQKDLIALLPNGVGAKISTYIKSSRIKWKKMQPNQLQLIIRECQKYME